jgi:DNA mismatch endonuclease (patch repair protein)
MSDVFTKKKRSEVMSKIRGKNTQPELIIRKFLFSKGFRFRIHQASLSGKPDIVLKKHQTVIFIHGCFWHGHKNCKYFKYPKNNGKFWKIKIENNILRDFQHKANLKKSDWRVITIWECALKPSKREKTFIRLLRLLAKPIK